MPGPKPKDPIVRARRNRVSTQAVLTAEKGEKTPRPALTAASIAAEKVHPNVHRWWRVIWRSPMAARWLESDAEVLFLVAALRNAFWAAPSATLAAEIRHQEARLGLDVISRRRLDWRIEGSPQEPGEAPAPEVDPNEPDPRAVLRLVEKPP